MPTNRKISELPAIGTPARTNVFTMLDALGANVRGAISSWLALTTDADLQLSDITTNDVSSLRHGFTPKLPNDVTKFLDGTGAYVKSGWKQLDQVVTTGSQSTVLFQNISQLFSALRIQYTARSTAAGTGLIGFNLQINGDATAGNYTNAVRSGTNNTSTITSQVPPGTAGGHCGDTPADGNTAGITASGEITIVGYAGTTWHKRVQWRNDVEVTTLVIALGHFRWASTAAIVSALLTTSSGAFKDNSIFTLYGIP